MIASPRTAELLLEALGARAEFCDAVLGDLAEEFARRVERDGVRAARRWYHGQAIRAAPHLLRSWSREVGRADVAHLAGVVLTSYVFLTVIVLLVAILTRSLMGMLGISPGVLLVSGSGPLLPVVGLMLGALGSVIGGGIAAWLGERAPLVSAFTLGVTWSCVSLVGMTVQGTAPAWYRTAATIVVIVGTVLGGIRHLRASRPLGREQAQHAHPGS